MLTLSFGPVLLKQPARSDHVHMARARAPSCQAPTKDRLTAEVRKQGLCCPRAQQDGDMTHCRGQEAAARTQAVRTTAPIHCPQLRQHSCPHVATCTHARMLQDQTPGCCAPQSALQ